MEYYKNSMRYAKFLLFVVIIFAIYATFFQDMVLDMINKDENASNKNQELIMQQLAKEQNAQQEQKPEQNLEQGQIPQQEQQQITEYQNNAPYQQEQNTAPQMPQTLPQTPSEAPPEMPETPPVENIIETPDN